MKTHPRTDAAIGPHREQLMLRGKMRRDRLGVALLGVSVLGIGLNSIVFPRLSRIGGLLQQVSTGILFARAIAFTVTGVPGRQRSLPWFLTRVELVIDGVATAAGFWAWIVHPFLRHRPSETDNRILALSRAAAIGSFVLHTMRLVIYLSPGRGVAHTETR